MFNEIVKLGAKPNQIEAKIVGGANMFSFSVCYPFFNVGEKNILVAKRTLHKKKIKLIAQDIGGDYGRRVEFDCSSGKLRVKSIKKGEKEI
jgi:chemotaxis protein CheD